MKLWAINFKNEEIDNADEYRPAYSELYCICETEEIAYDELIALVIRIKNVRIASRTEQLNKMIKLQAPVIIIDNCRNLLNEFKDYNFNDWLNSCIKGVPTIEQIEVVT